MAYPSLYWHSVRCIQALPSQKLDTGQFGRTLLIRGRTWDGQPETLRIELFGDEEIAILEGGTPEELEQAANELLTQTNGNTNK